MIQHRKFVKSSGNGCRECKAEIRRIGQIDRITYREDDPPFRYDCPSCGSVWGPHMKAPSSETVQMRGAEPCDFELFEELSSTKCARCGKLICLAGSFGSFGDSEPEGTVINGAAYCWDCVEKTAGIIEGMPSRE
jgi:hypothetical protein